MSRVMWTRLSFGKHKGKILPQIILTDPDWFYWASAVNPIFWGRPGQEAANLAAKAARIKIPKRNPKNWAVEYVFDRDGRFERWDIVKADSWMHRGWDYRERSAHLDLLIVAERKTYDKSGNKKLLRGFRRRYFGNTAARMTERRCEAFFDNDDNFVLPRDGSLRTR
jgi:hypothetical protein